MHVPGDNLIERIADANQRTAQLVGTEAVGMKQRTMSATRRALLDNITSHNVPSQSIIHIIFAVDKNYPADYNVAEVIT